MVVYFLADDSEARLVKKADKNGAVKFSMEGVYVKIGRTDQPLDKRRHQLQTGNPRPLRFMGHIETENIKEAGKIESMLHQRFNNNNKNTVGEWYKLDSDEVFDVLREFPYSGFVTISEDSLKVLGYDRDAIPEIGGVGLERFGLGRVLSLLWQCLRSFL